MTVYVEAAEEATTVLLFWASFGLVCLWYLLFSLPVVVDDLLKWEHEHGRVEDSAGWQLAVVHLRVTLHLSLVLQLLKPVGCNYYGPSAPLPEAEAGSDARDSTGRPTNPGYQRKTWSAEEDAAIQRLIAQHGTRWRAIAPHLAGRSDDSVRNRWKRISEERGLKMHDAAPVAQHSATPTVKATPKQSASAGARSSWSRSEDQAIVNAVREFGPRWCSVATCLPQRTEQAVRNRWNRLQQRARVQARALSLRRSAAGSMGPPPAMERLEQQQQAACV